MKNSKLRFPNPFDDSAIARQMRMGLLASNGTPNKKAISMLAQVYAALFFDRLCDLNADMDRCVRLCEDLCSKLQTGDAEKLLLPSAYSTTNTSCPSLPLSGGASATRKS